MNLTKKNLSRPGKTKEETSEIIISDSNPINLNFSTLSNEGFSNINVLYSKSSNPIVIYTALRYGKRYILKGLSPNFRNDPIQNIILNKEFEIGLSLEHPNIRQTIGFEEVENLGKVIILEYVDGISLMEYMKTHTLSSFQARTIVNQLASAVRYIHSKQIIHKDLKSSNILLTHHGLYPKIIDFNLADSDSFMILKNPGGTINYMAPELLNSDTVPSNISDIYSFGIVIREIAENSKDNSLLSLADKLIVKQPSKRPQSLDEVLFPKPSQNGNNWISRIIYSKITTYICGFICILLIIFIYFSAKTKLL